MRRLICWLRHRKFWTAMHYGYGAKQVRHHCRKCGRYWL